jgi:hypothetical protein
MSSASSDRPTRELLPCVAHLQRLGRPQRRLRGIVGTTPLSKDLHAIDDPERTEPHDTSETARVRGVMWGRRFLAATVPPDVAELSHGRDGRACRHPR